MYFGRYPNKNYIVSEILIKCDQEILGMLLITQITEFTKVQSRMSRRMKFLFYLHRYPKKQSFDSNGLLIYV